jgi:hypothetical protein
MQKKTITFFLVMLCSARLWAADYSETQEKDFTVNGKPELVLRNSDGLINITPGEGTTVHVKVTKEIRSAKDDAHAKKDADQISIEMEQVGNQIRVITHWPHSNFNLSFGRRPSKQVRFEITTPVQSDMQTSVSDGEIYVTGIQGTMDLHTSDGMISAKQLSGDIQLRTSDGKIEMKDSSGKMDIHLSDGRLISENCSGSVRIDSGDSRIILTGFKGEANFSNSDGDVEIDGMLTAISGKVSDGSMHITASPGSVMENEWSLRASDGSITLNLPQDFSANLDLSTSDGHLQTDHPISVTGSFSSNHITGKLGDGGHLLQVHTSDGNIAIK